MGTYLNGKKAIITGASSGIGRATAKQLATEGVDVAIVARSVAELGSLKEEIGKRTTLALPTDLTDPLALTQMIRKVKQEFGRIDILHANAGLYIGGQFETGDPDEFDTLFKTNINATIRCIREVVPEMIVQNEGDIIVTSSVSGHQAIHWEPIYSASKHAIQSFVHGLRIQLGKKNIRVGEIAPGIVLNELWGFTDPEEIQKRVKLGEGLQSCDIADAVLFMLSRPRNVTIRDLVILPREQEI